MTAGEEDALQDAIIDWAGKNEIGRGGIYEAGKLAVGKAEKHLQPILHPFSEGMLNEMGESAQEGALRKHAVETLVA